MREGGKFARRTAWRVRQSSWPWPVFAEDRESPREAWKPRHPMGTAPDSRQDFYDDYVARKVHNAPLAHRGKRVLELFDPRAESVLDVGCGDGEVVSMLKEHRPALKEAVGMDLAASVVERLARRGARGVQGDAGARWPFADESFQVVICAEVIEHVFDTDLLVREAFRVLAPGGQFIVTTPNLAYLANRVLLMLGVQPLATETSTSRLLGRWLSVFGQNRDTEGHLRIFTGGALEQLLAMHGFTVERLLGYSFPGTMPAALRPFDRALTVLPRLSFGFAVSARKPA
jgi:methionine biosynthesis protein MetW